jgi:hypothetical protein
LIEKRREEGIEEVRIASYSVLRNGTYYLGDIQNLQEFLEAVLALRKLKSGTQPKKLTLRRSGIVRLRFGLAVTSLPVAVPCTSSMRLLSVR